ncbi:hypothetical protein [Halomonas sp. LBP4]|uniref:hypothetical protein n=1 Tax=Halomonas sp. LBP4 TaxID=2044917 RepID=UPI0011B44197|nr:hypothetical protein [Halomonas sp. LBP4]
MYRHEISRFTLAIWLLLLTQVAAAESSRILTCTVSGDSKLEQRVVKLTVIPPKPNENLNLWALTEKNEPGVLIKQAVGKGEIEVDYGGHTERRDLFFLSIGNENGSSHVAFWLREGVFQHPNFIIVDVWKPDISVQLMESVEPQPYLTGNCSR